MAIPRKNPVQYNKCPNCGKDSGFSKSGKYIRLSNPNKFCSYSCSMSFRHKDKVIFLNCPACDKKFRKYAKDGVARKHCSMKCYNKIRKNNFPKFIREKKPKKYYKSKKINGKVMLLHRWIMEQHLGRSLTEKEVVHHINGDPHDNRVENLMLMSSQSEHIKLELKNRIYIPTLSVHRD